MRRINIFWLVRGARHVSVFERERSRLKASSGGFPALSHNSQPLPARFFKSELSHENSKKQQQGCFFCMIVSFFFYASNASCLLRNAGVCDGAGGAGVRTADVATGGGVRDALIG